LRLVRWIGGLILAAVVVTFALSNRQIVQIGLWPLIEGLELPLYLAVLLPLLLGILLGWLGAGLRGFAKRRAEKKASE
jgi:uncharacterized integral membrane protein